MFFVKGKVTTFKVIDNLIPEPNINQKLTPEVIHQEFDSIDGKKPRHSKNIDPKAIAQAQVIASQPLAENTTMVQQPDSHFGSGVPIGTTLRYNGKPSTWKISPTIVSSDIGCGLLSLKLNLHHKPIDFEKLDKVVENFVPSAFHDREFPLDPVYSAKLSTHFEMPVGKRMMYDLLYSLGTIGSGNHFLEVDKDKHGDFWLVIHSGSRHVGSSINKYYLELAQDMPHYKADKAVDEAIKKYKKAGLAEELGAVIPKIVKKYPVLKQSYKTLSGVPLQEYLHDTVLGQKFASHNRNLVAKVVMGEMGWTPVEKHETIHNYFDPRDNTIRKGAISGYNGEFVSIPMNMRDGTIFAIAKGNPKFNYSLPHGAGRAIPRSKARHVLNMGQYIRDMKGIHSSSIDLFTLDEAPEAYKPYTMIENAIKPNAKILDRVKPVYNYKDHQSDNKFLAFQKKMKAIKAEKHND